MGPRIASLAMALALALAPAAALADHYFVFPEVGLGFGRAVVDGQSWPMGKLDFLLGTEWDTGGPRTAVGWLLDVSWGGTLVDAERFPGEEPWQRLEIAPMLSLSSGYNWWTLFARVGVGPHFLYAWHGDTAYTGGGVQVDAAVGSKNAIEFFTQAFASVDRSGPSFTAAAGLRLNVIGLLAILDFFGGHSHHHHHSYGFHGAGPAY